MLFRSTVIGVSNSKRLLQDIPNKIQNKFEIVSNVNLREWFGIDKNYCESTGRDVYQQQQYAALLPDYGNIDAFPFFKAF